MALAVAGVASGLGRRGQEFEARARRRCGWRCCSRATASTAASGGPRAAAEAWSSARCSRRSPIFASECCSSEASINAEASEGQHPQLADRQPALGGPAGLRRRDPLGHELRPARWPNARQVDQGSQPRARVREVEPVGPQELLNALQLAHLLDVADDPDAARALSGPRLRPTIQGRGQRGDQSVLDAVLVRRQRFPPRDQLERPAQARRISRFGA